jgi:hypothetical protein
LVKTTKRLNGERSAQELWVASNNSSASRDLLKAQAQRLVNLFALPVLALVFLNLI